MQQLSELWIKYRVQVLMIVIAAVVGGYWILNKNNNDALISNTNAVLTSSETGSSLTSTTTMKGTVAIDIKGAVKMPGVYELKADDRVNEALKAAGGPLPNADLRQVNLAKQLTDQQMIYIPLQGETPVASSSTEPSAANNENGNDNSAKINLNTATKEQLCQITGIGDKKADLILQYRQEHGQFKSIDELKEINGFGEKTVAKLKDHLSI
ncbi:helix-hairpin-helix domain-containing protein [Limosilactobacillus reuteri]|uniref:Competence protein ComEA n=1 Tax=Limosilactobacillus reuteri TaxID=1598 RepID=A0A073JR34_LIMRT|nr:helix-hairpin-helix domain-containing protein [Limosilactobacillus reuteri]KEK16412.1 competence protein ComEA [Limosilactobacillus reuteri]KEK16679.1 competence protein ComEA [Limosilactobacillus reuteri]MCC4399079.1 helix-hairpin-helix domain-containing protein [Limosilactobacillus reuteri]MCC4403349.1 helix-hairpin-helix domain-containing protein [Limosilactobacillus reuteri]MCC4501409.1 helix-hairpin-helix domain-containing protein [Limosilactobacillus reuteri]